MAVFRNCSPTQLSIMLELGADIIAHHLLPQLPLRDLLSLRQTCKDVQANIDANEWDRRYLQEFCFDTIRLGGRGMRRYIKRYSAKIRHMGDLDADGTSYANEAYDKSLKYFERTPIVDFDLFDLEIACGEFDCGAAVRSLNGDILIHSESGSSRVLPTNGLSGVHLCDEELIAWKDYIPRKANLIDAFWYDDYDEDDVRIPRQSVSENLALEVDTDGPATDDVFKLLGGHRNSQGTPGLCISEASLKYSQYKRLYYEGAQIERKIRSLIEQSPGPLDTLWLSFLYGPTYVVAGSSGSTLTVILGGKDHATTKSYRLPFHITKIGGARHSYQQIPTCDINVLGDNGTLYCLRLTGEKLSEVEWRYPLSTTEPFTAVENAADLAGKSLLMKDGTIQCFVGPAQSWIQLAAKNVVLITPSAYLTTD